jgi:hypothetical protein
MELNIEWPRWLACNITVAVRCYFHFHFQGQHNKLERDRVNQSEGRLSTRRFSVRLWEIEGLFTDRAVFHDSTAGLDWLTTRLGLGAPDGQEGDSKCVPTVYSNSHIQIRHPSCELSRHLH